MWRWVRTATAGRPRFSLEYAPIAALCVVAAIALVDPGTIADPVVRGLLALLLGVVGVRLALGARDATRALRELDHVSRSDDLTGLGNQSEFSRRLEEEVQRGRRYRRRFGIVLLDVDGLKRTNDVEGHIRGDQLLRAMGRSLREAVRGSDLAFRVGGDEFAVVLPETDREHLVAAAARLRESLLNATMARFGATVSVGVAEFPSSGMSSQELMRAADRAMYADKARTYALRAVPRRPDALPPEFQPDPRRAGPE